MSMTLDEAIMHCRETSCMKDGACGEQHRQLAEWLEELKMLREKTRWIPISERVPEDSGYYLFSYYNDFTDNDFIVISYWNNRWNEEPFYGLDWRDNETDHLKAWMPLSEPYKEKP